MDVPPEVSTECSDSIFHCNRLTPTERKDCDCRLMKALRPECIPLTPTQRDKLVQLLIKHSDIFALQDEELGMKSIAEHKIDTEGCPPIKQYE